MQSPVVSHDSGRILQTADQGRKLRRTLFGVGHLDYIDQPLAAFSQSDHQMHVTRRQAGMRSGREAAGAESGVMRDVGT